MFIIIVVDVVIVSSLDPTRYHEENEAREISWASTLLQQCKLATFKTLEIQILARVVVEK